MSKWKYAGHVCDYISFCPSPCDHAKNHKPYVGDNPASSDCSRWFHCDVIGKQVRCLPVEDEVVSRRQVCTGSSPEEVQ